MSVHEQFAEDLALHALGSLQGDGLAALQTHLQDCADCRRELELLRGDMGLLAMSTAGLAPPRHARQRLLAALTSEPRHPTSLAPRRGFWSLVPWFAAAAAGMMVVLLVRQNRQLQNSVSTLNSLFAEQRLELQQAQEVVETLTARESQQVTLVAAKNAPQPQGKTFYLRNKGHLIFLANNLPQLPPEKIYELWLIPKAGAPIAAGLFQPDSRGSAAVVNPPLPVGVEAKTFAVTLETGSGSHEAPRGPFVIMGTGE